MNGNELSPCVRIGGVMYTLEPVTLHRRFFYGGGTHMHTHDLLHFILLSHGSCRLLQPNRAPIECPQNSLVVVQPEHPHDFSAGGIGCEHSCFILRLRKADGTVFRNNVGLLFGENHDRESFRVIPLGDGVMQEYLSKLNTAIRLKSVGGTPFAVALIELFMQSLRFAYPEHFSSESSDRKSVLVSRVRRLISENLFKADFSLDKLARQVMLNKNYLNQLFRTEEGIPIREYVIRQKLACACQRLAAGERSKDVAYACNFTSQNYFSRLFKQRFHCSPAQYRNEPERYSAISGMEEL